MRRRSGACRRGAVLALAAALAGAGLAGCSGAASVDSRTALPLWETLPCVDRVVDAHFVSVSPDAAVEGLWDRFEERGTGWSGGDSVYGVALPEGGILWSFADTFLGGVLPGGRRPPNARILHNVFVLQEGTRLHLVTARGGGHREALVTSPDPADFYLATAVNVDGDEVQVFYLERREVGSGTLDSVSLGSYLGTFALPSLSLLQVTPVPSAKGIAWGAWVLHDGGYTYVYGASANGFPKRAYVARVRGADVSVPWQYYDGRGWSPDPAAAAPLDAAPVQPEYSVTEVDGVYVMVTSNGAVPFSHDVDLSFGCSPTGPFGHELVVHLWNLVSYSAQAVLGSREVYVYDAKAQPVLSHGSALVFSVDENTLVFDDLWNNVALYRPRYYTVRLSFSSPVPMAPSARSVTPPAGAGL